MTTQTRGAHAPAAWTSRAELRCTGCGQVADNVRGNCRCRHCGELLEVVYPDWPSQPAAEDAARLKQIWRERRLSFAPADQSGVWRFREFLPILRDDSNAVSIREGNTPLYELTRCARLLGMKHLFAKHQGMNPTGSFKDTGMTAAISLAKENQFQWVACASTGNTSAAMAAYAARAGMGSLVLIPEGKIAWGKLAQALDYGAVTCQLKTDFDGCVRVLNDIVERLPVYLVNSVNPYRLEGQKTAALELMEQLDWQVPDHIIVPGGNLANSSAIGKAFFEMKQWGLIDRLPKISVIQAAGANPLVRTIREYNGTWLVRVKAETMATAIRIGNPASWRKALHVLHETGGACEDVTDPEIALAKAEIGSDGIGCEPASAATLAGLKKLLQQGIVKPQESVVLVLTGHLLKDPEFTLNYHRGELFPFASAAEKQMLLREQRAPVVLEADPKAVIRELERAQAAR